MAKKKFSSKKMMSILIAFIMVSSIFGVILGNISGNQANTEYNGYKFDVVDRRYRTEVEDKEYFFYNFPSSVASSVNISENTESMLSSAGAVYIAFDPDMEELSSMDLIRLDLSQFLTEQGKFVDFGVTEESVLYPEMDNILSCENATESWPVILFRDGVDSQVYLAEDNPGCIIVESETYLHRIRVRDAIIYNLLGIID